MPPKEPPKAPEKRESPTDQEKKAAPPATPVQPEAKKEPTPEAQAQRQPEKSERRDGFWDGIKATDIALVFLTAALAIIGFFQTQATAQSARATASAAAATTQSAAATAEMSAHNVVSERGYVTISHDRGIEFAPDNSPAIRYFLRVVVTNWGRTPAHVREVRLKPIILPADQRLPEVPDYSGSQTLEAAKAFLVTNDSFNARESLGTVTKEQFDQIVLGTLKLHVIGFVRYEDVFEQSHWAGYARLYKHGRPENNLVFIDRGAYSYDRDTPPPSA